MSNIDRAAELRGKCLAVTSEFDKYVIGMSYVGKLMISSAIQGGICHFLAEGVPGTAKTRSVEVIARLLGGKFAVIQFTGTAAAKDTIRKQ